MPSLYSVYRPKYFKDLVGQSHITKLLKAELQKDLAGHAYLFIGPRGTGKTTTARIFSKALNCTALQAGEPCGECPSCVAFEAGKFVDLIEIDAASNRGIDEIREIKEKIEYNPSMGKQKIYIVDEVHMLTKEAFNALLKTLEEPPSFVTFILATTEPQKVPATVMSRCEKFEFKLGSNKDLDQTLRSIIAAEKVEIDKKGIELLVTHAGGSYRDAVSLLDTLIATSGGDKVLSEEEVRNALGLPDFELVNRYVIAIAKNSLNAAFEVLEEIFNRGTNVLQFSKAVVLLLRDYMLDKVKSSEAFGTDISIPRTRYIESIKVLLEAYGSQKNAFDQRLPLQLATIQLINQESAETVIKKPSAPLQPIEKQEKVLPVPVKEAIVEQSVSEHVQEPESKVEEKVNFEHKGEQDKPIVKKKLLKKKKKKVEGKAIPFDEVERLWAQFAREVQKENKQLFTFIMPARPSGAHFDGQLKVPKVEIKVPFEFHRKQLENPKNQMILSAVAVKVYGTPMQFICIISKEEIVFKKPLQGAVGADNFASPAIETIKIDAKPVESALESAFDSVLGADVETL